MSFSKRGPQQTRDGSDTENKIFHTSTLLASPFLCRVLVKNPSKLSFQFAALVLAVYQAVQWLGATSLFEWFVSKKEKKTRILFKEKWSESCQINTTWTARPFLPHEEMEQGQNTAQTNEEIQAHTHTHTGKRTQTLRGSEREWGMRPAAEPYLYTDSLTDL